MHPMSENTVNLPEPKTEKRKKTARVSRRVAVFGTFVLIFAIIGIIATVIMATRETINIVDNKSQKDAMKRAVFPLVLLDPPPFDSIDKLDSRTILSAAMWDFIIYEDKGRYQKDDLNNLTVPAVDIETHIVNMFGKEAPIEHQELSDSELQILYDAENNVYSIPSAASMVTYVPKIEKITRKGDIYTVTVGYLPSGPVWGGDITGQKYEPEPDKYLKYILKKTGKDSYIITAVQEMPRENQDKSSLPSESEQAVSSEPASSQITSVISDTSSDAVPASSGSDSK